MESYTEPALFGSLQMRQAAANALRNAYFQRDMVNCDPIATWCRSVGPTVRTVGPMASPEKPLPPRLYRPPQGPTGRAAEAVGRTDRRPRRFAAAAVRAGRDR